MEEEDLADKHIEVAEDANQIKWPIKRSLFLFVLSIKHYYILDMETKKIYVVSSFGGEWEDKWEHIECAFTTKEAADKYIKDSETINDKISDELFEEVKSYLAEKEYEMQSKYYDPTTAELYKDVKQEDYDAAYDEFYELTRYELIKEKFNIEKEDYDMKEHNRDYDFVGYMKNEIELYD